MNKLKGFCRCRSSTVKLYEENFTRLVEDKKEIQFQFEVAEIVITSSSSTSSPGKKDK